MTAVRTTTIGSLHRFKEDLHESIDEAMAFQRSYGLDILTDGEQRSDMVSYFAESFAGLAVVSGVPVIQGRIVPSGAPEDFSKVEDLRYILSKHPDAEVKVAVTGPTTLGMTCGSRRVSAPYSGLNDFALYEDIADALAPVARALSDAGAYVQVDEPFLSQGYRDLADRVGLVDRVVEGLPRERVSVHVCGYLGRYGVLRHLLGLENVSTLSFGFSGRQERGNLGLLRREEFEGSDKSLGVGCIAVTPVSEEQVDTPAAVRDLLVSVLDRVGAESVAYAHPDCGLRATRASLVPSVMESFRAGVDAVG